MSQDYRRPDSSNYRQRKGSANRPDHAAEPRRASLREGGATSKRGSYQDAHNHRRDSASHSRNNAGCHISERRTSNSSQNTRAIQQHSGTSHSSAPQQYSRKSILIARAIAVLILIAVIAALVALGSFVLKSCSAGKGGGQAATTSNEAAVNQTTAATASSATTAPEGQIVMTLGGDKNTVVLKGEDYLEAGCHALDKTDGDITSSVTTTGEVDTTTPGEYTVTYTATNSGNAQQTKTRTVSVVDNMEKDTDGITVLMYHYVYKDDNPPEEAKDDTNYLPQSKLKAQLKWLKKENYYFPSYQELRAYVDGAHSLPKKSVVLTFDDAESGFLKYGIPMLEQYEVPATSFVICDRKAAKKNIKKYASEYVTFQSHSYSLHNDGNTNIGRGGHIYDLTEEELVADIQKAAKFLGTNEAFAYPYGDVSDCAPSALKTAGTLCAFTIDYDQVYPGDNPYKLSRIRVFGDGELSGYKYQVENGKD